MGAKESIGVDIGGTNIRAARISREGDILAFTSQKVFREREPLLKEIQTCISEMITDRTEGIGIGVAGRISVPEAKVLTAGYLDLRDVSLGEIINNRFNLPVVVDSDAYMAMFAESKIGSAKDKNNIVMFTIGTGVGGAVLLDGKLFYGKGAAGQLGHLTIDPAGNLCNCGRRGCVETFSSGTALGTYLMNEKFPAGTRAEDLLRLSEAGDERANRVLDKWIHPLRMAIDSACAAYDPEVVLLGGGLGKVAYSALKNYPEESAWFQCEVRPAVLGDDAGVIGSGLRIFYR